MKVYMICDKSTHCFLTNFGVFLNRVDAENAIKTVWSKLYPGGEIDDVDVVELPLRSEALTYETIVAEYNS